MSRLRKGHRREQVKEGSLRSLVEEAVCVSVGVGGVGDDQAGADGGAAERAQDEVEPERGVGGRVRRLRPGLLGPVGGWRIEIDEQAALGGVRLAVLGRDFDSESLGDALGAVGVAHGREGLGRAVVGDGGGGPGRGGGARERERVP